MFTTSYFSISVTSNLAVHVFWARGIGLYIDSVSGEVKFHFYFIEFYIFLIFISNILISHFHDKKNKLGMTCS